VPHFSSLQRWSRDKIFSFVPPDGKFTLAEYRYSPNTRIPATSSSSSAPSLGTTIVKDNVPIPFSLKTNFDLQEYSGIIFDFSFASFGKTKKSLV
jgi:AP-3 complex subunit mu